MGVVEEDKTWVLRRDFDTKKGGLLLWDSAQVSCVHPGKSGLTMSMASVVGVGHSHRRQQF